MFGLILLVKIDMEVPPAKQGLDQYPIQSENGVKDSLISALTTSSTSEGGNTGFCRLFEIVVVSLST